MEIICSEPAESRAVIPNSIDFYNAIVLNDFMNNRIVELEDGDVVSEGYTRFVYVIGTFRSINFTASRPRKWILRSTSRRCHEGKDLLNNHKDLVISSGSTKNSSTSMVGS